MAYNPLFEEFLKQGGIKSTYKPEVNSVGRIFVPQAQYERYMDSKLGFNVSRDNENFYGENQSIFEKIGYAIPKFVGNTAINIVGNLTSIPVGIASAIFEQDASKLIDNSYTQALDSMSDSLNDTFKFYKTKEEEKGSVLNNMFGSGAANFWLDDFLNGASFAIGALASEAIATAATAATFGGAGVAQVGVTAKLINRAGKIFKAADKVADAAGAFKYADDAIKLGQEATEQGLKSLAKAKGLSNVGTFARQQMFGTMYEASVEARHHMKELKDNLVQQAIDAQGGGELTADQLEKIDEQVKSSGTGVFLANTALLSLSNAAQFNHFTYGVKNLIGKTAGKEVLKGVEKSAFKEVVDETGKNILKPAFETWGKVRKTWEIAKLAKNPLSEGLEESLQSVINNGYSEYSMNKLNPYSQEESVSLVDSFGEALSKQFDLGNKEGWKEFVVGAILGGAGIPMYGAKGVDAEGKTKYGFTLMGGVADDIKERNYEREQTKQYAKYYNETASKSPLDSVNIIRNTVKAGVETNSISKQYDEHIRQGNFKEAKDAQEDIGFSFIKAAFDTGRFENRVEGVANDILEMDNQEFAKQFGYDGFTEQELQDRKESVVKTYQKLANDVRSSIKLVDSALPNINESLRSAIAHSLFKDKRIDDRIKNIITRVNEIAGLGYNSEKFQSVVDMFAKTYVNQPENGKLVNKEALNDNIAFQKLAKEYDTLTTPDTNLTLEESVKRNKKAEQVKSEIETLLKKYPSIAKSMDVVGVVKNINEYNSFLETLSNIKNTPGINKDELNTISDDLNKLFGDKIRYTALYNYLFTKEGQTKYDNIETALKEVFEESVNKSNEELSKDPIFKHKLSIVLEGMGLPASLITKGEKLNLGILKDRESLEKQAAIDKAKNKKQKDTNSVNNKKTQTSNKVKITRDQIESEEIKNILSEIDTIISEEIDVNNINNSKDLEDLKSKKLELESFKEKLEEELVKGNKSAPLIKTAIDDITDFLSEVNKYLSNFNKNKIISDVAEKAYRHGFENLNRNFFVPENATDEEQSFYGDLEKQLSSATQEEFDKAIESKSIEVKRVSPPNAGKQYESKKGFFYVVPEHFSLLYVNGKLVGSIENPQQYMYAVENSDTLIPIDWFTDLENPSDLFLSQISVFNGEYVVGNKLSDNAKVMITQARGIITFYNDQIKNKETVDFDTLTEYFNLSKNASKTDGISRSLEDVYFSNKLLLNKIVINDQELEGIVLIKSVGGKLTYSFLTSNGEETIIPNDHPVSLELNNKKSSYNPFFKYGSHVIFYNGSFYPAELPTTGTWEEGSNKVTSLIDLISKIPITEDEFENFVGSTAIDSNGNYPVQVENLGTVLVKTVSSGNKTKNIGTIKFSFSEQANTPNGKLFIPTRPTTDKNVFPFGEIDIIVEKEVTLETGKTQVKLTMVFPVKGNPSKAGYINFYLNSDNLEIQDNKVVGFKPDLDGAFEFYTYDLSKIEDTNKPTTIVCNSITDLFKHINDNRVAYSKKSNLGGLEFAEINIKEDNQDKSGFKLVDGNPLNITVKQNPDGAIKLLPKDGTKLSKPSETTVQTTSTKKIVKPESMKVEESVVKNETQPSTTTPTYNRTTSININGETFNIGLTELQNLVNALSLTDTDTLSRSELTNYINALKFLAKFESLKEYITNYLSAIVESQNKELAPINTYRVGKIFPMKPKTNGVSNNIIKDSFDQVKSALLTSLQSELNTLKATPQQTAQQTTASDVITDDIYNTFVDKNIVPDDVLNSIVDKVISRTPLSQRETAIFSGKTSEINQLIRNKATEETKPNTKTEQLSKIDKIELLKNNLAVGVSFGSPIGHKQVYNKGIKPNNTFDSINTFSKLTPNGIIVDVDTRRHKISDKQKVYKITDEGQFTLVKRFNVFDIRPGSNITLNASNINLHEFDDDLMLDLITELDKEFSNINPKDYSNDHDDRLVELVTTFNDKTTLVLNKLLNKYSNVESTTSKSPNKAAKLLAKKLKEEQQNSNSDESSPFSIFDESELEQSTITYEQAVRNIAELLPDTIDIRDINEVIEKLSANGIPAGVLFNRIVYLSKNFRNIGTEYHEAFHAVFRLLLTDNEIQSLLDAAKSKYGKPSIDQLLDLRDKSSDYVNLSEEQLIQLWYEEKLADEFAKYATNKSSKKDISKGLFAKLWNLIKSFLNLNNSSSDTVETYFDNILNKSYKNREVRSTLFPTFVNFNQGVFQLYKNGNNYSRTSSESQRITAQTLNELLKTTHRMNIDLKDVSDELIIDAFKEVINSKYDPDLYWNQLINKPDYEREAIESKIYNFYETLYTVDPETNELVEHSNSFPVVINEVRNKLKYYEEIVNENWDVSENEEETPDQLSSIESYKIGGFSSAPAFMRFFMSTVELTDDIFGIGLDVDTLSKEEQQLYLTTADGYKIYNGVLSRVSDLRKSEILPALMSINNNKNIEAFRKKLLTEVLKEYYLNTGQRNMVATASYMNYDPDIHTHKELSKTALYNMFLRTFDKARINPKTTYVDQKNSGKSGTSISIGRANLRGVDQKQLEQWDINWSKKKVNFKTNSNIIDVLNDIYSLMFSGPIRDFSKLNETITNVKNKFAELGIELHEDYIKASLLLKNKNIYNKEAKQNDLFSIVAVKFLSTVPASLKAIKPDMINGMISAAKNLNDPNRLNLFGNIATVIHENEDGDIETKDLVQATSRYRQMAEGNAFFDENVVESNYRNADGETVYSFVEKSYITTFTKQAKNIFEEVFEFIDENNLTEDEASDMLLEKMIEAEFLTEDDYYLAKSRIRLLTKNFLFKNKKERQIFLNNLDISFIDGLVDRPLKKEKGEIDTNVSKGSGLDRSAATFGSLSVRDKLLYNIFNFFNKKKITDDETIGKNKVDSIEMYGQSIGVQSDKNTHFLIEFISKNYITLNNYTNEFYENVYNLMMGEYTRIIELQQESKDLFESLTQNKSKTWIAKSKLNKGYEDFHYIRKNGIDWYIVDGEVKGIDRDNNIVENTIGIGLNNFRGLQIYNFNPSRYKFTNKNLSESLEAIRQKAINKEAIPSLDEMKPLIKNIMDFQFERYIDLLASPKINALTKLTSKKGETFVVQKQQLLPTQLFGKKTIDGQKQNVLQEGLLKNFFFNYYLNNMAFSQMFRGDRYLSSSDPKNGVKRESKNNASGPSMGIGTTRIAIVEDNKQVFDELERTGVKVDVEKTMETADAQGIARMNWHSTYLRALGKTDIKIVQIYRNYEKTGFISNKDLQYLESKGALMQTLKLVYSADKYLKTAITFLNRRDVSTILPENENVYKTLVDAKHVAEDNNGFLPVEYFDKNTLDQLNLQVGASYNDIVKELTKLFIPLKGREKLHALLNKMDLEQIDFTVYKSGSKTVNKDVGYFHNNDWVLYPSDFTNSNLREQVVTENLKTEGIDGTQKMQLITAEQFDDAESTFNEKRVKVGDLVKAHDKHLANRISLQYERLKKMLITNDGKAIWDYLLDQFIDDLVSSGKNPLVLEYAKGVKNNAGFTTSPTYNLNHPFVEPLFQQTFLSFASKNSTKSKANLVKFTLVSDEGINIVRDVKYNVDPKLVEIGDKILNTKLNKDGSATDLTSEEKEFVTNNLDLETYSNNFEKAYAEWRSKNVIEKVLTKEELSEYSYDKYNVQGNIVESRLKHRVLDKDGRYYSECIVSEWFLRQHGLKVGDKIPERLLKMLGIRIPTQDKHSMVTLKIIGFKEVIHGSDIHVPREVLLLSGADFDIDALYTRIVSKLKNQNKFFGDYIKSENYNKALKVAFQEFIDEIKSSKIFKKHLKTSLQNSDIVKDYNKVINILGKQFEIVNQRIIEEKNTNYVDSLNIGQLINLNDTQYRIENITEDTVTILDLDTNVSKTLDINAFNSMFVENTESQFEKINRESSELFDKLPEDLKTKYRSNRDLINEFGNSVFNKFISDLSLTKKLLEESTYSDNKQLKEFDKSLENILKEFGIPSSKFIVSLFELHNDLLYNVIIPGAFNKASAIEQTLSSFENKYKSTITNNLKAYNEGRIQDIEPITVNETNNILLEIETGLVHNSGNKDIAGTPATLTPLRKIEEELSKSGVLTDSEHYGEDSPLDHYNFAESIEQGKKGIGIVAVSNILAQLLYKNNISIRKNEKGQYVIDPIFNSKTGFSNNQTTLEEILNDEGLRKNDIKSTVLSAMTDNAKEVLAGVFNLNNSTLGIFDTLLDMGVSLRKSAFFTRQPILQSFSAENVNKNAVILSSTDQKIKKQKLKGNFTDNEYKLFSNTLLDTTSQVKFDEGVSSDKILTEDNLKNAILFETHLNQIENLIEYNVSFTVNGKVYHIDSANVNESLEDMKVVYNEIQKITYKEFKNLQEIQKYLFPMTSILSLSKGFPSSFSDIDDIKNSLQKLGIQVSKGNPLNPSTYELSYSDNYKYIPEKYLLTNILEMIESSNLIKTNIQTMYAVSDMSKEFFIMNTETGRKIYNSITNALGPLFGVYSKQEFLKVYPTILSALNLAAYRKQIADGTIKTSIKTTPEFGNPHLKEVFDLTPLFDIVGNERLLNKARMSNEADVNLLLKTLAYTTTSYKDVENSPLENRVVGRFVGDTISKRNPDYAAELIDAYSRLVSNPDTRDLAVAIFNQIILRDGMMFTRDSLITHISPTFMKSLLSTMDVVHELLLELDTIEDQQKRNEIFIDLFGMEEISFIDNIQKLILQSTQFTNTVARLDSQAMVNVQKSHVAALKTLLEETDLKNDKTDESTDVLTLLSAVKNDSLNRTSKPSKYSFNSKDENLPTISLNEKESSDFTVNDVPIKNLVTKDGEKYIVLDMFAGCNLPEFSMLKGKVVNKNIDTILKSNLAKVGSSINEETGAIQKHLILSPIIKSDNKVYKLYIFTSANKTENGKYQNILWNPASNINQLSEGLIRYADQKIMDAETALDYKQDILFTEEEIQELKNKYSDEKLLEFNNKKLYDHVNNNMLPIGLKAIYIETEMIGTKEISTIAGTVAQWENLKKNKPNIEKSITAPTTDYVKEDDFFYSMVKKENDADWISKNNDSETPFEC